MFLPKGKQDYPVVILVHGGAWIMGDNRCCGLYSSVGEFLASQGIAAVLPNYRLSPGVKHPEHIKDLARASSPWTKNHIAEHGGRADEIFLMGHSAGGHLVALLTTDEKYLQAQGCRSTDIKGVIGLSGVYRIPPGKMAVHLGGRSEDSFHLDEMTPLRGTSAASKPAESGGGGLPVSVDVFGPVFGEDPAARLAASPLHYVRPGLPPFLFLNAEKDLPLLPKMAEEMHEADSCRKAANRISCASSGAITTRSASTPSRPAIRRRGRFSNSSASTPGFRRTDCRPGILLGSRDAPHVTMQPSPLAHDPSNMRKSLMRNPTFIAVVFLGVTASASATPPDDVKTAVTKSITLLEKSAAEYLVQRKCFSCHHQAMHVLAFTAAKERGFAVNDKEIARQLKFTADFLAKNRENYAMGKGQGGQADTAGYALLTLAAGNWEADETTTAVVEYLLARDKDARSLATHLATASLRSQPLHDDLCGAAGAPKIRHRGKKRRHRRSHRQGAQMAAGHEAEGY